ncbi:PREDICTED: zinc finger and BTB domain-containing protein 38 [Bison bison bison]|uniref:Zinc finger and BTB domain-containing protein 38 n=1 Tax=Bison bison bison TaxID=43346 RepID=A0A6P3IW64_BISBB|nr:PREDICTED: zinc finger and BTB domain-containing protein 38 [Bison bison bison]XP_010856487.1 PREDICTED: zinc finger and BTB domain-containing protein 38 [Bison bison bison]XP_010856488.1 PREDICTED: zinc finger and BTB domain-containing protein 38 [Bison bison bison]XP_010856489.1 PREDICTED: zinc finger and BTB domain-containing protein 38 [Bison bison bison]XP_010856490.1 PREDICTED: zinc finger and BTB domain-containing protein 38 [Bison bison bison]XP_010856491.1 PREDICTED: zinc finger an
MTVMSLSRDLKDNLHSDTVLSILNEQRIRGILCDVTIIVEDTKFKAHSNVLAASSLYFKNIFWSHTICISSHVLELDDLKAEVFTEILNYIYSSTVVVKRQETVTDLAAAGKKLGISFLEDLTDRNFSNSPGPYVFCITEKGVVKEEKNEKRHEEPAITNGPRITNAFSIIETENSNNMFSPLDLRASFKKVSDSMRNTSLCLERTDVCHEVEPVRTLAEHSYAVSAVSSVAEAYRSQPAREQDSSSPAKTGKENSEAVAAKPKTCRKPKTLSVPQESDSAPENIPPPPASNLEVRQEESPQPAAVLSLSKSPSHNEGEVQFPRAEGNKSSDVPGPPAAEVPPLVYNCSCCSKSFESSTLLSAHMQLHKPTQEPLVCKHCNKQFSTLNRLDRHEQICMRSSHMPVPGGNQRFLENYPTIGQNGSSFTGPEPLLAENRIGDFSSPGSTLPETEHIVKFVNGQMLYSCVVCKRSYVTLSSLRRHANVHSWRRTYPCHYCNKVFALAEYRTRHEIWHTGERRYQCIFCLETFMTYYILKNHQKSFHAIDHRLSISKKTANGGLKPSVYPYKLYRLLPMKCKRAPYKSYRHSSYENARENSQLNEPAPGPYVIQNPHSSELPTLNFQDSGNTLTNSPAIPLETPARQDVPTSASIQNAEGTKWGERGELKVDLDNNFYSTEVSVSSTENAVSSDPRAGDVPVLAVSNGSENSTSVISYSGSAPSVIVHSSQFSSVIMHSNAIAAMTSRNPRGAPSDQTVSQTPKEDGKPAEPDKVGRAVSRPKSMKEKKKAGPCSRGEVPEESKFTADPGGSLGKTTNTIKETSKIETYIAKPALPGTSTNSNVAPLCQITVKIGNEAIVKRHILGSKLFYKRGRRPKYQTPEETLPQESDQEANGDNPLGLCQSECMEMSEMFDDASDQDSTDKPWRPYYNYKPKKKSRQLRKMRKANWRKEHENRSPSSKCRYPADLDCAVVGKAPQEKAFEEEENKEMPKLQCELCDDGDKASGAGSQGRPHRHLTARPYACELCAKQFQSPSTLKMHMRCHTGEKPYQCKTCGRCFSVHGNLQKHERIHLGVKEFVCQYCNKAFTLNETLKIHERIHTGEKRYHCQFCFQSFLYLSTKRNHEQRHIREHNGKGYACFQCPKICKTAAALGMHQKKHLFKSPSQQEKTEGDMGHENSSPLENPHFIDSEGTEQKDNVQTVVDNVL